MSVQEFGELLLSSDSPRVAVEYWEACLRKDKAETNDPLYEARLQSIVEQDIRPLLKSLMEALSKDEYAKFLIKRVMRALESAKDKEKKDRSDRWDYVTRFPFTYTEGWVGHFLGMALPDCPYKDRNMFADPFEHGFELRERSIEYDLDEFDDE